MQQDSKTGHEGKNIKHIREILGIKQNALAIDLGLTQQAASLPEQKETLDAPMLEQVAKALKVPVEAIKNFDEMAALNIICNTSNDTSTLNAINYYPTFDPIDKIIELYERMLQSEKEKVEMLQKLRDQNNQ
ncbi:MAG: helix-turn-helix transcriptional regulator [Parafilimonas sp.]|nr:helix-turn-helix transcriptional regulator [Parafilimonas sp.]